MPAHLLSCQRDHFAIPRDVAYLNCAYMSPQLVSVSRAGREAVGLKERPWEIGPDRWFGRVERSRALFAELVGGRADDVALVPSASYGIATAARNCEVRPGDTIVLLAEQFPSSVYAWHQKARQVDAELVTVPRPPDHDWTAAILEQLDARCSVAVLPAFHWSDGGRIDLVAIARAARRVDARLVLDLSQSVGAAPIDVAEIDPDWLVVPAYKWLLGPYSVGFLYVAPRWHQGEPLEGNWITRAGGEDFSRLARYTDAFAEGARRYDVGERSNFALVPMLNTALEQILEWGVESIEATLARTSDRISEIGARHGFESLPPALRAPHIRGMTREEGLPRGLPARLGEQGVHVGMRGDSLRFAPHLHVDEEDLRRLDEALAKCLSR